MPQIKRVTILPVLALILAMMSLQMGASLAKHLFPVLGSAGTTAVRVTFAALMMSLVFRPWQVSFTTKQWRFVAIYGISLGVMNFTFYKSIETIPLGIAVAIEFLGPLAVSIFYSRKWLDFFWIVLAACGILALLPFDRHGLTGDLTGYIYVLIAAFSWAVYIIFGQKASAEGGTKTVALGLCIAALTVLPIGVVESPQLFNSTDWLITGIALAILSSALPYGLEIFSLRRLPVKVFGILLSLEPAFGALFGFILLAETLNWIQLLGIFSVVCASAGIAYGSRG